MLLRKLRTRYWHGIAKAKLQIFDIQSERFVFQVRLFCSAAPVEGCELWARLLPEARPCRKLQHRSQGRRRLHRQHAERSRGGCAAKRRLQLVPDHPRGRRANTLVPGSFTSCANQCVRITISAQRVCAHEQGRGSVPIPHGGCQSSQQVCHPDVFVADSPFASYSAHLNRCGPPTPDDTPEHQTTPSRTRHRNGG